MSDRDEADLATWLLEQITEDERIAREGFSNQADPERGWGTTDVEVANPKGMRPAVAVHLVVTPHVGIIHEEVQRRHIVRWHPGRVLAECDAKRQRIELHSGEHECREIHTGVYPDDWPDDWPAAASWGAPGATWRHAASEYFEVGNPCPTLRLEALPYADRPGYREEWRP